MCPDTLRFREEKGVRGLLHLSSRAMAHRDSSNPFCKDNARAFLAPREGWVCPGGWRTPVPGWYPGAVSKGFPSRWGQGMERERIGSRVSVLLCELPARFSEKERELGRTHRAGERQVAATLRQGLGQVCCQARQVDRGLSGKLRKPLPFERLEDPLRSEYPVDQGHVHGGGPRPPGAFKGPRPARLAWKIPARHRGRALARPSRKGRTGTGVHSEIGVACTTPPPVGTRRGWWWWVSRQANGGG